MTLADFDYELPEELIAQRPLERRDAARMLVLYRAEQCWEDSAFRQFPSFLRPGDCLVLNDSKVFPSRLFGKREGAHGGRVEALLLRPVAGAGRDWEALVRPGRKVRVGDSIHFAEGLKAEVIARAPFGQRTLRFSTSGDLLDLVEGVGHIPLPPYIKRPDDAADRERYQTVFARERGSVAAPTAGLHFTPEILARCREAGAEVAYVTLHVGLGTFQPIRAGEFTRHHMHPEWYEISPENAAKIRAAGRRVAAGTTSVRALETACERGDRGETDLFIYPGYVFRATGALLTNFHLPRTSLLLLVAAFAGKDLVLAAYRHAVEQRYRFYSYGDCMLIV